MAEPVDIAIVGAGVAGLAATERANQLGLTTILLEASDRIGGRVRSVDLPGGQSVDLGAHWLYQVPINPLVAEAEGRSAITSKPWQPIAGLWIKGTWLSDLDIAAIQEQIDDIEVLARDLAEIDDDASLAELIDPLFLLHSPLNTTIEHRFGVPPEQRSAVDTARWGRQDGSWPVTTCVANLISSRFASIPHLLNTPVQVIDWGSDLIRLEAGQDLFEASHVIVTASTGVLASNLIHFAPDLPDTTRMAMEALSMTSPIRFVLDLGQPISSFPPESIILTTADQIAIAFDMPVQGKSIAFATILNAADDPAEVVVARTAAAFDCPAEAISVVAELDWSNDPWTRGGVACVVPGSAHARIDLAQPVDGRLYFAGEATSLASFGTVHGALAEGIQAVDQIAIRKGLLPEIVDSRDTSSVFRFDF